MYYDSLIIGGGGVGSSIKRVLQKRKNTQKCGIIDKKDEKYKLKIANTTCKTLHVCYPYSKGFMKEVLKYDKTFEPELIIIHSTVPVGTTEVLNNICPINVVHSPVRGQHSNLDKALLTFVKYIGTDNKLAYEMAKKEMSNMKTKWLKNSKETELGKILSTSYYGLCIAWHREMKKFCDNFSVSFEDVVTDFNTTYNIGYKKLRPNVMRPVLTPPIKKIGGHCVSQNAIMLKKQKQSKFLDLIL